MNETRNQAWGRYVLLPLLFLTATMLGGWRIRAADRAFIFVAPPLITLVLAVLLLALLVRGPAFALRRWLAAEYPPLANAVHAVILITLYFASAQAFNAVLPESGLFSWLFSFFFLWTLWQQQFTPMDAAQLGRSLLSLFGTAFALKYWLLANLATTGEGSWMQKLFGLALDGLALNGPAYAPASAYISFFALALYGIGLILAQFLTPQPEPVAMTDEKALAAEIVAAYQALPPAQQTAVRQSLAEQSPELTLIARPDESKI